MLKFWYHPSDLKSTSQPTSHSFGRFHDFDSFWKLTPLPKNKRCGGSCGQQFQTPVEHLVVCPNALTVSSLQAGNTRLTGLPIDTPLPNGKVSPAGCDDAYYVCDSGDRNEHKIRICGKNNSNGNRCNEPYRNCNNSEYDHGGLLNSKHGKKAGNLIIGFLVGFAPASGSSYTASAGDTHTGTVTASSIYGARLYVNGSLMGWFGGSTTATSLSLSYTFPSDASGDYTMMARVYPWSGDTYGNYTDYSYTVTIGSDDTTTTMHVCEVHELWQSGDHSWITPACGVSDHAGDACQIDVSHETSVSCPQENGVSCSYENYYTCSPHTHAYPDPLYACGNHSGDASLSSYHAHIASGTLAGYCTWHTFYQCSKSSHVSMTGGCGDTFYKCQENVRGHYRLSCWHRKHNGDRCRFRYWKCQNPSGIPSHTHTF